jgi:hypothetical protein
MIHEAIWSRQEKAAVRARKIFLFWSAKIHFRFRRRELIPGKDKAAMNRRTPNQEETFLAVNSYENSSPASA